MTRLTRWPCRPMMFLAAAAWLVGGCAPAPTPAPPAAQSVADHDVHDNGHDHDHDHDADEDHAQPETIAAGMDELSRVIEAAKKALADKNLDDADGHVHMVGHLVDDLHGLVKRAALPSEVEAAAKKALDDLYECFDDLDTKLHSSDEDVRKAIDYAEHEPRVEAAIKALRDLAKGDEPADPAAKTDLDE